MDTILNKQSGLLGISGISSDSRDIEDGMKIGNQRCALAQKMFARKIIDHIAKYYVELGGCDGNMDYKAFEIWIANILRDKDSVSLKTAKRIFEALHHQTDFK